MSHNSPTVEVPAIAILLIVTVLSNDAMAQDAPRAPPELKRKCEALLKSDFSPAACTADQPDNAKGCVRYNGKFDKLLAPYGYSGPLMGLGDKDGGTSVDGGDVLPNSGFEEVRDSQWFQPFCDDLQTAAAVIAIGAGKKPRRFSSNFKASDLLPSPELRPGKVFGNDCVQLVVREAKPWDDDRVTAVLELKNDCKGDQLVNIALGTSSILSFAQWSPLNGTFVSRPLWPDTKPYPRDLPFTPSIQLQSGFVIRRGGSMITEVTQFIQGAGPIFFNMGACDWDKNGFKQASFHDSNLERGFLCAPIP